MTLNYERHAPDGTFWWKQSTRIDKVTRQDDGSLNVTSTTTFESVDVQAPFEGAVQTNATILPSATVQVDIASAVKALAERVFKGFTFKAEGSPSLLDSNASPGDSWDEIHAVVSWAAFKCTLDYTDRRVLRKETITVPAGTFDCIVVSELKKERRPFYRNTCRTLTWYAKGYGLIRHDHFKSDGSLDASEQLVSISR